MRGQWNRPSVRTSDKGSGTAGFSSITISEIPGTRVWYILEPRTPKLRWRVDYDHTGDGHVD
jgi:hypothetical protein